MLLAADLVALLPLLVMFVRVADMIALAVLTVDTDILDDGSCSSALLDEDDDNDCGDSLPDSVLSWLVHSLIMPLPTGLQDACS